jgi:hypothetical protein
MNALERVGHDYYVCIRPSLWFTGEAPFHLTDRKTAGRQLLPMAGSLKQTSLLCKGLKSKCNGLTADDVDLPCITLLGS